MALNPETLGNKIGPRVVSQVEKSIITTRQKMMPTMAKLVMQVQHDFFKLVGGEIHETLGPLWRELAEAPDMPEWGRRTFGFVGNKTGQWTTFLSQAVAGQAIGVGLGDLITNAFAPAIQNIIKESPNSLLPTTTLAALYARGRIGLEYAEDQAARQGLKWTRFTHMVTAVTSRITPTEVLELYRRGHMDDAEAADTLQDNGIERGDWPLLKQLARVLLSPEALADMVVRGIIAQDDATVVAQQSGVDDTDFARMVLANGAPPGPGELLAAYRRGIIDHDRLVKGIRQSRVRNEWIDVIEALRFEPMSPSAAIQSYVQGTLSEAEARRTAEEGGLKPEHFDPLAETAGNPPGVETIVRLMNRGFFSRQEAEQAIRESQYKNKYIPAIMESARVLLSREQITMFVSKNIMTADDGITHLLQLGFSAEDAAYIVTEAKSRKTEKDRDLAVSQVRELYKLRALKEADAKALLADLGYDEGETAFLLALSDMQRIQRASDAAVNKVHALYVARKLGEEDVIIALDRLSVPADQRDDLIDVWSLEREANVRVLTPAETLAALKAGLITVADAMYRLVSVGYTEDDAQLLIALRAGGQKGQ